MVAADLFLMDRYIRFEECRVPAWHIVGDPNDKGKGGLDRAMSQIGNVRISLSASAVGTAMWVLDYLREEVINEPHRTGSPLATKESVQLRHAEMQVQVFAARSMLYRVARLVESDGPGATITPSPSPTQRLEMYVRAAALLCR